MARQTIAVSILAEAAGVRKGVAEANRHLTGLATGAKRVAAAVAGAFVFKAAVNGIKSVVSAASDSQQSIGATEQIYGRYADSVIAKSKAAASSVGLSANSYRELSNGLGAMLKNAGTPLDKLGGKTDKLVKLSADMAATFGGTTKDAVQAVSSLMRGEADPIEKYGVSIKQSDVNARLAAKGLKGLSGQKLKDAEATARLELLYKQTASAQGQFGRESNTLAGQQQRLSAAVDNIKARIGTALLPVMTRAATFVNSKILPAFSRLDPVFKRIGAVIKPIADRLRGLADGGGAASAKFEQLRTTVQTAMTAISSTVQSAVSIATSLWQTFGATITEFVSAAFSDILTIIRGAFDVIAGLFKTVAALLKGDWSGVWAGIKQTVSGAWTAIRGLVSLGWATIRGLFKAGGTALASLMRGAWNAAKDAVSAGISKVLDAIRALPGLIKLALMGAAVWLYDIGVQLIKGMINGIKSMAGKVAGAAKSVVSGAVSAAKSVLKIFSPSRVFRDIGVNTMEGLRLGIADQARQVTGQVARVAAAVASTPIGLNLEPAAALAGINSSSGARPSSATYYITVEVSDTMSPAEQGRKFASAIREYERSQGRGR